MNAMAHSVLEGIDAMMYKKECLGKVYCESNRHAKIVGNGFGFLMPLYRYELRLVESRQVIG